MIFTIKGNFILNILNWVEFNCQYFRQFLSDLSEIFFVWKLLMWTLRICNNRFRQNCLIFVQFSHTFLHARGEQPSSFHSTILFTLVSILSWIRTVTKTQVMPWRQKRWFRVVNTKKKEKKKQKQKTKRRKA